jgi:hypothetical protein
MPAVVIGKENLVLKPHHYLKRLRDRRAIARSRRDRVHQQPNFRSLEITWEP